MTLTYRGLDAVRFRKGWSRWLIIKRFTAGPASTDSLRLIGELMAHEEYGDSFLGSDARGLSVHAKWGIAELSPHSYRACAATEVSASLKEFAAEPGVSDPAGKLRYDELVSAVMAGPGQFWALDAPCSAEHETAWVLDDFLEFLWISEAGDELLLIAAGAD